VTWSLKQEASHLNFMTYLKVALLWKRSKSLSDGTAMTGAVEIPQESSTCSLCPPGEGNKLILAKLNTRILGKKYIQQLAMIGLVVIRSDLLLSDQDNIILFPSSKWELEALDCVDYC
jgi:hypothetical protein